MMKEGEAAYGLAERLFPICRSITGEGVRKSFDMIRDYISGDVDFRIFEIPTGTKVFDWEMPKECEIYATDSES